MADGHSSGTLELTEIDYSAWNPEGAPVSIHMHLDAVDGILRDLNEGSASLEVGGLLLGRVKPGDKPGDKPAVWIDRYERIPCAHKLGPRFLLDAPDQATLEQAANGVLAAGELAVVGLYRSHLRDGFDLENPDFELIRRYFSDSSDLVLLIKPRGPSDVSARFYVHDEDGGARPAGDPFPFRGRVLNPPEPVVRERPRRLVPDFAPQAIEQAAETPPAEKHVMPPFLFMPRERDAAEDIAPTFGERLKKWLPLAPALLLAGGAIWWFAQSPDRRAAPAAPVAAANQIARPLGLAVEPMGSAWQVSWNPNATALHDARSVQLFVRAGDDQNRIDLSPHDLSAGIYKYEPAGNDVTFRLEVVENSGRISAESFRFVRGDLPHDAAAAVAPRKPKAPAPAPSTAPAAPVRRTEPRVIHRAPPVITAGMRPRLSSPVALDIRVEIDTRGRVTSAEPVIKPHKGLDAYLAGAAVKAARLWRFEPARENGKPVAGAQTLHFVFQQ